MRAHYLQHVPFEGPGSIEPWLAAAGYELTRTPFYAAADLPAAKAVDFLVVMGGPMSVNDEDQFPWLAPEKRFIREVIESGKPVLGICLGAQLIAERHGGEGLPQPGEGDRLVPHPRGCSPRRFRFQFAAVGNGVPLARRDLRPPGARYVLRRATAARTRRSSSAGRRSACSSTWKRRRNRPGS